LWTDTGQPLAVLRWPEGVRATGTTFLPDGTHILVNFEDDTARIVWIGTTPAEFLHRARATLPAELRPDEESKFFLATDAKGGTE
jgi:hypothetical protein